MKNYMLFVRPDTHSALIAEQFRQLNSAQETPLLEVHEPDEADFVIAIGGDGSFIWSVTKTNFSNNCIYTGFHTGTLGFLQELGPDDIHLFLDRVCHDNTNLPTRQVYVASVKVFLKDGTTHHCFALNDVLIAGENYSKISFAEHINGRLFQNITGCGINIATSTGETAYSHSNGGSINFSDDQQLTCTLINPIANSTVENFSIKPIICPNITIVLKSADNIIINVDGKKQNISSDQILKIEVSISDANCITLLDLKGYSKVDRIREKILGLPAASAAPNAYT